MRRKFITVIAVPIAICLAALMIPSPTHKNSPCKGKMDECCLKKQAKPGNNEMIMESLSRQFIMLTR
jgi:hypothetical protein